MNLLHAMDIMKSFQTKEADIDLRKSHVERVFLTRKVVHLPKYQASTQEPIFTKRKKNKRRIFQNRKIEIRENSAPDEQKEEFKPQEHKSQKQIVTDAADDEFLFRQKAIDKLTRKKNISQEIQQLKEFEQKLLSTINGNAATTEEDHLEQILSDRRQQIYKKIYDNVKLVTGLQMKEKENYKRDVELLQFLREQQQSNKSNNKVIKLLLSEATEQVEALKSIGMSKRHSPIPSSVGGSDRKSLLASPTPSAFQESDNLFFRDSQKKSPMRIPKHTIIIKKDTPKLSRQTTSQQLLQNMPPPKKQDQQLLHVLVMRWKEINIKQKRIPRIIYKSKKEQLQQQRRNHIAQRLLLWLQKMNRLRVTLQTFKNYKFPKMAYEQNGSFAFFKYIKADKISSIKALVNQNQNLLLDYNHIGQGCLHIAAKYGHYQLIKYFLAIGVDYEQLDFAKRSALYYSIEGGHRSCFQQLIEHGVTPWNTVSEDPYFGPILKQVRKIHTLVSISPYSVREQILRDQLDKVF